MFSWRDLDQRIRDAERVMLTTHVRSDGDGLGSELAMADLLLQKGKQVEIFNPGPIPERYRFMDPTGDRLLGLPINDGKEDGSPPFDPDLILILDTGTWSQLGRLAHYIRQTPAKKVVIDHHRSQDDLGADRIVDVDAAACGMMIYEAYVHLHGEFTPASATAMFIAIAMDTGWFRHPNATAEVYRAVGRLVEAGARPNEVYRQLFEQNSLARLKLMATLQQRIELHVGGRLASCWLTLADVAAAGAHLMDTEDFIIQPMSIAGVETAIFAVEQTTGGTKISFRSRGGFDCSQFAERHQGGGHRAAAGARSPLPPAEAVVQIVAEASALM